MKNFILGLIIAFLICGGTYFYLKSDSLQSRVETLKSENLSKPQPDLQKAKEDFYIEQINRDSSLILFTVTALFAILGATTFFSVRNEFDSKIKEIKNDFQSQTDNYQDSVNHLKYIESSLSYEIARNYQKDYLQPLNDQQKANLANILEFTDHTLLCIEFYAKSILLDNKSGSTFKNAVKNLIHILVDDLTELLAITELNKVTTSINYVKVMRIKGNIEDLNDKELNRKLYLIYSLLEYEKLDFD
ncbi:MAG TPA: hypothetical protein PLL09_04740 [Flavobacterium sp.]|uniref:hypothetical protein n=1 Tax=unclassified Flavobacterium TaxID=196869 RepID=UPI0025C6E4C4|nr:MULTISPECIES: hypothetical protein [unclassified Flavobacterium]HRE77116.1 hypothetical protein [Flavobacterium sp.]